MIEPVSSSELREYLRLDDDETVLLDSLIVSARLMVEAQTGVRLISQVWSQVIPYQPNGRINLLHWPLLNLKGMSVLGDTIVRLDLDDFVVTKDTRPIQVFPKNNIWPRLRSSQYGISVDVLVGFGSHSSDVPEDLRQAVLILAANWYESNDWNDQSAARALPPRVLALMQPYVLPRL
jgi:uncharacterized phiE125 gp8 family phage protein